MTTEQQRRHLRFELDRAIRGQGDNFTVRLFELIAKADLNNRERLRLGFPDEVEVYEGWLKGAISDEY